ncbi:MAG TPA: AAA family ATPase [Kofleriaceae bacterium]|nr:AAA family ATPase [Kofleriaceae bacterium]
MSRLDHIEIEGYRSIRQVRLDLGALNILIGANGAGKSNLVAALGMLSDIIDRRLQLHVGRRGGANTLLHFGQKRTRQLRLCVRSGDEEYEAVLEPAAGDTLIFASEKTTYHGPSTRVPHKDDLGAGHRETELDEVNAFITVTFGCLAAIQGLRVFQFHDTSASSAIKQKHAVDDNRALRADGSNLAAVLHGLRQRERDRYRAIVDTIRSIAPFFDDFVLEPDAADAKVIQLEWRHATDPSYFNAHSLSDGTLRFMCLATLLHQPARPSMIVIDEPELGLHPAAIVQLAAMLRVAAIDSQIIVATQSVTLLDQFASEDVIVVERAGEESVFRRLAPDQVRGWIDDYSLGDLWLKNVLGGRP